MMKFFRSAWIYMKKGCSKIYSALCGFFLDTRTILIWAGLAMLKKAAPAWYAAKVPAVVKVGVALLTACYGGILTAAAVIVGGSLVAYGTYMCAQTIVKVSEDMAHKVAGLLVEKTTAKVMAGLEADNGMVNESTGAVAF